jgi:HK97 family phage major capsid protein
VTSTDLLEYVLETGFVNNAKRVPEATTDAAVGGAVTATAAGVKPQSTLTFEKKSTAVETFAHWVAMTKKSLADVPRLQTYVDTKLRRGLDDLLERVIVSGDPTVDGLQGILQTPGVQWENSATGVFYEHILKGMTKVQLAYFPITATAMNPLDWQDIRLARDDAGAGAGTGSYLFGPPSQAGATTLWGYPVTVGAQIPQHVAITGDWRAVELYIREGVNVVASDSHADFFVRNLVALLAEFRAALVIPQPEALCEIGTVQPS